MNDQTDHQPPAGDALAGLVQAYLETGYHVASPEGSLTFHVGQENSGNDMLLIGAGVERWAIVTAWNPHSQPRSWEENDEAQVRLKTAIESQGLKWWEAAGRHPSNDWPAEESCLILNIAPAAAREVCREFDQLAVLYGETGDAPWLLFGDWEQVAPHLKAANSDHPEWQSLIAQTIERNEAL